MFCARPPMNPNPQSKIFDNVHIAPRSGAQRNETDMATPEKINNQRQILNDQFSIASKHQACPMLPACDALELTLAFPFLTRGHGRIMRGQCAVNARSMRGQCAVM